FQILKDHLKKYSPEYASEITTISSGTIRRLAREFGEAARIGSTTVIDGVEVPYRPAAAIFFRGVQGHVNSTWNCLAVSLLNQICGTADAAGGALGFNPVCHGHPDTGRPAYVPTPDPDGMMMTGIWLLPHKAYPPHDPAAPSALTLGELFPMVPLSAFLVSADREEWWEKFKIPYRPKVLLNYGSNSIMSVGNKEVHAEVLKKFEFIISFDIFLNETTDFADIVLPDTSYMERLDPTPNFPFILNHPAGMGQWGWPIRQPLVQPVPERRSFLDVIYQIAYRIGLGEQINLATNVYFELQGKHRLAPDAKYVYGEIVDRVLKDKFGDDRGLEWFKEHGVITWPKKPEEVYWRHLTPVRVPVYFEFFQTLGEQIREIAKGFGAENDIKYYAYQSVPDWNPCPSHLEKDPSFDFYSFYYRDVVHTNSLTMENPWLDEAAQMDPYTYDITINTTTAKKKGMKDGDLVWVETKKGRKVQGKLKLSEGIHPEGLGIAALCGHWTDNQPIAKGKGVFYNELIEVDYEHMDPGNHSIDICAKVK
ncbi:MAG: molybdopterin dinucleotide binding domain-containing protein, partial [Dehalococcoidia bacterium]|nr:molybdopterin dinucleotide binding domain-containing protein [Dehalococcoidia bacterium]